MADFSLDVKESNLIDTHPTHYQSKYGEPQFDSVPWYGQEVNWDRALNHITRDVFGLGENNVPTTFRKPKEITQVSKLDKQNTKTPVQNFSK